MAFSVTLGKSEPRKTLGAEIGVVRIGYLTVVNLVRTAVSLRVELVVGLAADHISVLITLSGIRVGLNTGHTSSELSIIEISRLASVTLIY